MSRKEIWTIGNRKWFERLMVLLFIGALGCWFYFDNADFIKALESIVVFSVTGAFVILAGGEAMLGVLAEIRRKQREEGREEGRKEGRMEGRSEVLQWIREQEEAGVQFKDPPPYSPEKK